MYLATAEVLPKGAASVPVRRGRGSAVRTVAAAGFVLQFAIGGTVEDLSLSAVLSAVVGVHVLIGIGEAVITFLTVGLVMKSRRRRHGARRAAVDPRARRAVVQARPASADRALPRYGLRR